MRVTTSTRSSKLNSSNNKTKTSTGSTPTTTVVTNGLINPQASGISPPTNNGSIRLLDGTSNDTTLYSSGGNPSSSQPSTAATLLQQYLQPTNALQNILIQQILASPEQQRLLVEKINQQLNEQIQLNLLQQQQQQQSSQTVQPNNDLIKHIQQQLQQLAVQQQQQLLLHQVQQSTANTTTTTNNNNNNKQQQIPNLFSNLTNSSQTSTTTATANVHPTIAQYLQQNNDAHYPSGRESTNDQQLSYPILTYRTVPHQTLSASTTSQSDCSIKTLQSTNSHQQHVYQLSLPSSSNYQQSSQQQQSQPLNINDILAQYITTQIPTSSTSGLNLLAATSNSTDSRQMPSRTSSSIVNNHNHSQTASESLLSTTATSSLQSTTNSHPLYQRSYCRWPSCDTICVSLIDFTRHLNEEHSLDDRSVAQARVQQHVVQQLEALV
ncbi:unnamed protein product, partial [Didymodactylos carnosus]